MKGGVMKRLLLLIAMGFGVTGCASHSERLLGVDELQRPAFSANASAQHAQPTVQRFTQPFALDDMNPCNEDSVRITGELRITVRTIVDAQGGQHFAFTLVPQHLGGESASGTHYKVVGGDRQSFQVRADGTPLTTTFTTSAMLISQGGADNFLQVMMGHLTINANGELTVQLVSDRQECRG